MRRRDHTIVTAVLALAVGASLALTACSGPPPALTKTELDAKKPPTKHPKLTDAQKQDCRGCHREQPPIRKP